MTPFVCKRCGYPETAMRRQCPVCNMIGSIQKREESEVVVIASPSIAIETPVIKRRTKPREPVRPISITRLNNDSVSRISFPSGFGEVLGGGAILGSSIIVTGEPGIGKSTLVLQTLGFLAEGGTRCLYVSGEESVYPVAERARRTGASVEALKIVSAKFLVPICNAIETSRAKVVLVDSVNVITPSEHDRAGGVVEINQCSSAITDLATKRGIVVIFIAHVTKDGDLSGPKAFEHLVDVVLTFEGKRREKKRVLGQSKNRFGPTTVSAVYDMTSSGLLLKEIDDGSETESPKVQHRKAQENQQGRRKGVRILEKRAEKETVGLQEKGERFQEVRPMNPAWTPIIAAILWPIIGAIVTYIFRGLAKSENPTIRKIFSGFSAITFDVPKLFGLDKDELDSLPYRKSR